MKKTISMPIENKSLTSASNETEARSKLKSQFELFSRPLPTEIELFAMWDDNEEVIASIACATFNHGPLLEDAIKSFLLQKTNFRFEIVIRDDASTDGTREVIAEYRKKFPRIIKTKIYEENQYKIGHRSSDDWIELTSGKYIALCEGDDFWIDQFKLRDQIDQIKKNGDVVISVAGTLHYNIIDRTFQVKGLEEEERIFKGLTPLYHHTSTIVVDRQSFQNVLLKRKKYMLYGDMALRRLLVEEGACICLPRVVSVYWLNDKGVWTSLGDPGRQKERIKILIRTARAVRMSSKFNVVSELLLSCKNYFPIAAKNREWKLFIFCLAPFFIIKFVNSPRWAWKKILRNFSQTTTS